MKQMTLALEPEAGALYCKQMRLAQSKMDGGKAELKPFPPNTKYLVLDLGGIAIYRFQY